VLFSLTTLDVAGHSRALPLFVFRLFIGPTLFSLFPPVPKRRILAVTVWCVKLKIRRLKPDTSVTSVWWRYMFQIVLGCITPQKTYEAPQHNTLVCT